MMNIKGTSELFSLCPSMSTSKVRARTPAASVTKGAFAAGDSVQISAKATYQAGLAGQCRQAVQLCGKSVPQTRIEELKQQYSGEQCPVSANEIAGAMLHQIGGLML